MTAQSPPETTRVEAAETVALPFTYDRQDAVLRDTLRTLETDLRGKVTAAGHRFDHGKVAVTMETATREDFEHNRVTVRADWTPAPKIASPAAPEGVARRGPVVYVVSFEVDYEGSEVIGAATTLHDAMLVGEGYVAEQSYYEDLCRPWDVTGDDPCLPLDVDNSAWVVVRRVPLCPAEVAR